MEVFSLLYQITLNDNFSDTCSLRGLTLELVLCLCHFVTLASLWHLIDASSAQRVQISLGFGGGGGGGEKTYFKYLEKVAIQTSA